MCVCVCVCVGGGVIPGGQVGYSESRPRVTRLRVDPSSYTC